MNYDVPITIALSVLATLALMVALAWDARRPK